MSMIELISKATKIKRSALPQKLNIAPALCYLCGDNDKIKSSATDGT